MKGLFVLAVAAVLAAGCNWGQSPDATPTGGTVWPGSTCAPIGAVGVAGDGTPMRCSGSGVWRAAVRAS